MGMLQKKLAVFRAGLLFWALLGAIIVAPLRAMDEYGSGMVVKDGSVKRIGYQRYSNLAELVTMICDDAAGIFQNFYGPEAVEVSPFAVMSDYKVHKMTMLGITLADQMASMINREPAATCITKHKYPQKMEGVIEEMDGYLRVHITGRNLLGEGRSYVVNVEMSEPVYRFLHSYVESYRKN